MGRNIQAGRKALADPAPPGDPGDPLVQESQGAPGCQADSPLKALESRANEEGEF